MATRAKAREPIRWFQGKAWFWGPVVPLIALDLWSKSAVFSHLAEAHPHVGEGHRETVLFGGPVQFSFVSWRNTGTIWGLGKDFTLGLIALRFVAIGVLVYAALRTAVHHRLQQFVLGLILAGAIGNLYDNLTQPQRAVRDFLKFTWVGEDGTWTFPAFNVADSCICVGAFTLFFLLWREDAKRSRET